MEEKIKEELATHKKYQLLVPDLDIQTRWNSTYLMLNKFLQMRILLDILVAKHRDLLPLYLQENNCDKLKIMINILRPIFDATEILSTSTYPTISDVRLTIFGLIRHLSPFLESTSSEDRLFVESINSKLKEYWNYIEESTTISTLLDPRSKTKTFTTTEQREKAINILQNQMKNYSNQHNHIVSNIQKSKRFFFESLLTEQSSSPSIEDEITRYIAAPVTSDANPLTWWHHYKGSSVPSEQAFSIAANVITKIRCNLKPESARAVMRLKSWIPKVRDKHDKENDLDIEILSES
ncbi:34148_t:CDS:2 [Racocetra persica]|uniref:34148_t:CDS:1 n=1 Tax=Racocetra persica TaxID=160502 RepID=A0ACA9MHP4_9GLOM|nr:34148_t:CDS:2 [Racocetra persica]